MTFGATEAIAAALLGLLEPGDEVVLIDPAYDAYAAASRWPAASAGRSRCARRTGRSTSTRCAPPSPPRTRALLLNTPHNPTGKVFSRDELEAVAAVCREHDLIAISDEVYEHLVFDGEHVPLATLAGMAERTLTISSLGKTFSRHGLEDRLGDRAGRAGRGGARGQAVPDLRRRHAVPARGRGRARHGRRLVRRARRHAARAPRPALRAGSSAAGLEVLVPQATYFANVLVDGDGGRVLPRAAGTAAASSRSPRACSTRTPRSAATWCASRSASARGLRAANARGQTPSVASTKQGLDPCRRGGGRPRR